MATMPRLVVAGTCFVLTGRMWKERKHIERDIIAKGGSVSPRMKEGCALVMASALLYRGDDNKWHIHGKHTAKAKAAFEMGALVYHEKMLMDALASPVGKSMATRTSKVGDDAHRRTERQQRKVAVEREPEWNDAMHAEMMARATRAKELLASFQD